MSRLNDTLHVLPRHQSGKHACAQEAKVWVPLTLPSRPI